MDYYNLFPDADYSAIKKEIETRQLWLERKSATIFKDALEAVSDIKTSFYDFYGDTVIIGKKEELSDEQHVRLRSSLEAFIPWRKGPFNIFGHEIDAEWASYRKWDRIIPELPNLENKVVADIGANNGYYMFRMGTHSPKAVIGFDPVVKNQQNFVMLNSFLSHKNLSFELLGVENIALFKNGFDVIFLMGIIYHHPSPVEMLRMINTAMKPSGSLILETQGIPGDEPVALFPVKTYAKAPGTYFVPTVSCTENFLSRAGFKDIKTFYIHSMSSVEQRKTEWMPFESYADFVSSDNPSLTVEGYPAPIRIFTICKRR